jgi:2-succinyl-5-enolpyruvyl-6-hydroxy-3-cyclohexene-1-carboxylate synthase
LVFLTADRPIGAVERGENQAINQAFIFERFTYASLDINGDETDEVKLEEIGGAVSKAVRQTGQPYPAPVHINVRLSEPLYEQSKMPPNEFANTISEYEISDNHKYDDATLRQLNLHLNAGAKKIIVVGTHDWEQSFAEKIALLGSRNDVVILAESISNLNANGVIHNYDACLNLVNDSNAVDFAPDLVITLGRQIVSKRIAQFLKTARPLIHWDIGTIKPPRDMFDAGVQQGKITEELALDSLIASKQNEGSQFHDTWQNLNQRAGVLTGEYSAQAPFSDFKVFGKIIDSFPKGANIHYGNSSPVRYSNFFEHKENNRIHSNRGTSGIDGSLSTAAGSAYASEAMTICVIGDISFFYDSNALWNNYLSPYLRIILINNSGGNIFRLIDGPTKVKGFEKFFETTHQLNASNIAKMYGLDYYFCDNKNELNEILEHFYNPDIGKPAILEVKTDGVLSAEVFKGYFAFLRKNRDVMNVK